MPAQISNLIAAGIADAAPTIGTSTLYIAFVASNLVDSTPTLGTSALVIVLESAALADSAPILPVNYMPPISSYISGATYTSGNFTEDSSSGGHQFIYNAGGYGPTAKCADSYTFWIDIAPGLAGSERWLYGFIEFGLDHYQFVLDVTGQTFVSLSGGDSPTSSIVQLGGGWIRATITNPEISASFPSWPNIELALANNSGGNTNYSGDNTSGLQIKNVGVVEGTTTGPYAWSYSDYSAAFSTGGLADSVPVIGAPVAPSCASWHCRRRTVLRRYLRTVPVPHYQEVDVHHVK